MILNMMISARNKKLRTEQRASLRMERSDATNGVLLAVTRSIAPSVQPPRPTSEDLEVRPWQIDIADPKKPTIVQWRMNLFVGDALVSCWYNCWIPVGLCWFSLALKPNPWRFQQKQLVINGESSGRTDSTCNG